MGVRVPPAVLLAEHTNIHFKSMLAKARIFFSDVRAELQKCSWPWDPKEKGVKRYKELINATTIVLVAMLLLSGFVSLCDLLMMAFVGFLTR